MRCSRVLVQANVADRAGFPIGFRSREIPGPRRPQDRNVGKDHAIGGPTEGATGALHSTARMSALADMRALKAPISANPRSDAVTRLSVGSRHSRTTLQQPRRVIGFVQI